jgi:glycosyltransferase involved in cell wall biosynthesis
MAAMNSETADVTVVMPAFQAAATIGPALDSIADQTTPPREVIVVDDGSTDGTVEAVRTRRTRFSGTWLRLFRQDHRGPGAARNRALSEAQGRYIAFLDADDLWLPTKLERSLEVLRAGNHIMVAHDIIEVTVSGERHVDCRARWLRNPGDPLRTLYLRGYISSSTVVVEREAVLAAGGFNADLPSAQDYDLWLTILARIGPRFELFAEPLLRYHLHGAGITGKIEQRQRCNLAILRAHVDDLKRTPGAVLPLIIARTAAVHLETIAGYRSRGDMVAAMACAAALPWECLKSLAAVAGPSSPRRNYLADLPPAAEQA